MWGVTSSFYITYFFEKQDSISMWIMFCINFSIMYTVSIYYIDFSLEGAKFLQTCMEVVKETI